MTPLTPRELAVVRLVARGLNDKDVARELRTSPYTVRNQLASARGKLGLANRTLLALYAVRTGIAGEVRP